ncbi:MAG: hypothetical protein AAF680_12620 [Pseudomonadota bacterium]
MNSEDPHSSDLSLSIEFAPDEGDPSRIFKSMAQLIESFQDLDRSLLSQFDLELRSELVLHDVERGSLKAILRNLVKDLPDDALENADWKRIIGHYLLKGKYAILKWTDTQESIEDRTQLEPLEGELLRAAEETQLQGFPGYKPIAPERILGGIKSVTEAAAILDETDALLVDSELGRFSFNGSLAISDLAIREVLTSEVIKTVSDQTLLVKKPDYLGRSMWSFQYRGHAYRSKNP